MQASKSNLQMISDGFMTSECACSACSMTNQQTHVGEECLYSLHCSSVWFRLDGLETEIRDTPLQVIHVVDTYCKAITRTGHNP
jgi:hypothetical protein